VTPRELSEWKSLFVTMMIEPPGVVIFGLCMIAVSLELAAEERGR